MDISDPEGTANSSPNLGWIKAGAALIMCTVTLVVGLAPIKVAVWVRRFKSSAHIFCSLRCFGGGVLMATGFLHIIPDARHSVEASKAAGGLPNNDFPLIDHVVCAGFFMVYFIEEMSHIILTRIRGKTLDDRSSREEKAKGADDSDDHNIFENNKTSSAFRTLLLILAMSFHALFEGLAVGIAHHSTRVWYLLGAMLVHKSEISFAMGLEMASNDLKKFLHFLYIGIFAAMTPLGAFIGLFVAEVLDTTTPRNTGILGIVAGITGGTVVYVTFFEILFQQIPKKTHGLLKFTFTLLGFATMALINGFFVE